MSSRIDRIALELNSTAIHLLRGMKRVDDSFGVSRARLSALSVLVFGGPTTMSRLADAEGVTPPTMHHVVKGLEAKGLVVRKADTEDGRKTLISPSRKGRGLMMRAREARLDLLRGRLAGLSKGDLASLERATEILREWEQTSQG